MLQFRPRLSSPELRGERLARRARESVRRALVTSSWFEICQINSPVSQLELLSAFLFYRFKSRLEEYLVVYYQVQAQRSLCWEEYLVVDSSDSGLDVVFVGGALGTAKVHLVSVGESTWLRTPPLINGGSLIRRVVATCSETRTGGPLTSTRLGCLQAGL